MALTFRLADFEAAAPDGVVIGLIGENGAGKSRLLRLAAGVEGPVGGTVEAPPTRRLLGPMDALDFSPVELLLLDNTLAGQDALARERAAIALERMRRAGTTTLLVSHEEALLVRLADEVWWVREGKLARRGDPGEVWKAYRFHIAQKLRALPELAPAARSGDGRAVLESIELLGEDGWPTAVWRSGEMAVVRVTVRFRAAVENPVIGMLIRTRVGLNVYGTNTELEGVKAGPVGAGEARAVSFAFRCELCAGEYTLTAASHDPDGTRHDWMEDAVGFSVADCRYTAGVANLRARVTCSR